MLCTKIVFLFLFWHSKQYLYTTCCELVFFLEFNEQSLVTLWVNWCKNEGFWKRFTCISHIFHKWDKFGRNYHTVNTKHDHCSAHRTKKAAKSGTTLKKTKSSWLRIQVAELPLKHFYKKNSSNRSKAFWVLSCTATQVQLKLELRLTENGR